MSNLDPKKNLDGQDARQGRITGHMRYVLLFSLILVVLGFIVARFVA
jgi:hypothetical protein